MLVKISGRENCEILTANSRDVAEHFEKEHKNVVRDIERLGVEIGSKLSVSYFIPSEYQDSMNRKQTEYLLTRDGFSLLVMGFTGQKALEWKLKYITAFNEMETELKRLYAERHKWEIERAKGILIRHILTDTIKMKVSESPHKRFAYPNYTKLIYRSIFGMPLKELEQSFGVKPKESVRDYLNAEQLKEVESMEMLVSSLINIGMGYDEIKSFISERYTLRLSA